MPRPSRLQRVKPVYSRHLSRVSPLYRRAADNYNCAPEPGASERGLPAPGPARRAANVCVIDACDSSSRTKLSGIKPCAASPLTARPPLRQRLNTLLGGSLFSLLLLYSFHQALEDTKIRAFSFTPATAATMSAGLIPPNPADLMVIRNITPNVATFSVPFSRFGRIKVGGRGTLGMNGPSPVSPGSRADQRQ